MRRRSRFAAPVAVIVLTAALSVPLVSDAQQPGTRQLTLSRGAAGVDTLHVRVEFAAGRHRITPAANDVLYDASIRYDAERARPLASFDESSGHLTVGTEAGPFTRGFGLRRTRRDRRADPSAGEMTLRLGQEVPTTLDVRASAAHGDIELGGIPLHAVRVGTTAGESSVRFSAPNPGAIDRLELSARAASLRVQALSMANANHIVASVTAGQLELEFGDGWTNDPTLDIRVLAGEARLLLPRHVGVRIMARERLWGGVTGAVTLRNGVYLSDNWETARHRLDINASVTMGGLAIVHAAIP